MPGQREAFLDFSRALAVVAMVFAHFTDQLLDPDHPASAWAAFYSLTRGFTAPLFFVVSGWSFALVVIPHLGTAKLALKRRLKRAGVLLLWGYALTLPWWAAGFPFGAPPSVWIPFWSIGVLQSLAAAIFVAVLLLKCFPRPAAFLTACGVVGTLAIAAGASLAPRVANWPALARGFFDPQGVGGSFPIAPWLGFFFAGLLLGGWLRVRSAGPAHRMGVLLLSASGALLLERLLPAPFDLVFLRMGVIACVLAVASLLTPDRRRVPRAVRGLNHSALTCYVLHMVLLWGAPGLTGLVHWVGPTCGWWECLGLTLACLSLATFGGSVASLISARTSAAFGFATQPQSSTQDAS